MKPPLSALWGLLLVATLALAALPYLARLPAPGAEQKIDAARWVLPDAPARLVALPHQWPARAVAGQARYELRFDVEAQSGSLYVLFPVLSQDATVYLNGRQIYDSRTRSFMFGSASGVSVLIPLPADRLLPSTQLLEVDVYADAPLRGYLPPAYLGSIEQLGGAHRLRVFLLEHLRLMIFATQLLMALAILVAYGYRPRDRLFAWLALFMVLGALAYFGALANLQPRIRDLAPYLLATSASLGLIAPILAILINGWQPARSLRWAVLQVPILSSLLILSGVVTPQTLVLGLSLPLVMLGLLAATLIAGWGAFVLGRGEAHLILAPLFLISAILLRDGAVALGFLDGPVFLTAYYRPLMLLAITAILMRRLGVSLGLLDAANAHLRARLAAREAELERLHREERRKAAERVREEERNRLTVDLHDGLGGHLASIIALAERPQANLASIEQAAREALDDLRLVIYSLDIGDRELPLALSSFHERLSRQLKRLGVSLDWSIARLPEVGGVTPSQALNVLRILQEAVTNGLKHGPASHISIRGSADAQGRAVLCVENDGAAFAPRPGGAGLRNMQRRAALLNAELELTPTTTGSRLLLTMPTQLPDTAAAPAQTHPA